MDILNQKACKGDRLPPPICMIHTRLEVFLGFYVFFGYISRKRVIFIIIINNKYPFVYYSSYVI